jgi:hypothetical protein
MARNDDWTWRGTLMLLGVGMAVSLGNIALLSTALREMAQAFDDLAVNSQRLDACEAERFNERGLSVDEFTAKYGGA